MGEYMHSKTERDGTQTSLGFIPHLKMNGFQYPVKLDFSKKSEDGFPPLMFNGKYVYALPGGGQLRQI